MNETLNMSEIKPADDCGTPDVACLPPGCEAIEFQFELGDLVTHKTNPTLPWVVHQRFIDADVPPCPAANLYLVTAMDDGGRLNNYLREHELAAYIDRKGQVTKLLQQIIDEKEKRAVQEPAKAG